MHHVVTYSSKQIVDWILSKIDIQAGDTISPLKLQKLLYYCQAWHLTIFGEELFSEKIEAWSHGPVIPSQYHRFSYILRNEQIKVRTLSLEVPKIDSGVEELLNEVINMYGEHSASYLENLTHQENPWKEARGSAKPWERSSNEITHKSMIDFYSSFLKNGQQS